MPAQSMMCTEGASAEFMHTFRTFFFQNFCFHQISNFLCKNSEFQIQSTATAIASRSCILGLRRLMNSEVIVACKSRIQDLGSDGCVCDFGLCQRMKNSCTKVFELWSKQNSPSMYVTLAESYWTKNCTRPEISNLLHSKLKLQSSKHSFKRWNREGVPS